MKRFKITDTNYKIKIPLEVQTFLIVLVISALSFVNFGFRTSTVTGSIMGVCTLPDSSVPAGISVVVLGTNLFTLTDASGHFFLTNVPAGMMTVQAGKLFYGNASSNATVIINDTIVVNLALSSVIVDTFVAQSTSRFTTASTNVGNIGVPNKFVEQGDSGFSWLGLQQLKEASLMIGVDAARVSDAARFIFGLAQDNLDQDFQSRSDIIVMTSGPDSTIHVTAFDDSRSNMPPGIPSQPMNILVTQTTSSYGATFENGYLLMSLKIKNVGYLTLNNLLVGWFVDWNAGASASTNRGEVIEASQQIAGINNNYPYNIEIAYQRASSASGPYMGIVPLSQAKFHSARIASVQQEIAVGGINGGLTEANKYNYMSVRRTTNTNSDLGIEEDLSTIVSVGGTQSGDYQTSTFSLQPGEETEVGFAFVGGTGFSEMVSSAQYAQKAWIQQGHTMDVLRNYWHVNAKWNLVSLPVDVINSSKLALFPSATSQLFTYVPGCCYEMRDTLASGTGYWLKFPSAGNIIIEGALRHADTLNVAKGWNLIGSLSFPVPVSSITSAPTGIIITNFWYYDTSYHIADTLHPMQGYWIKVNQDGQLILFAP